MTPHEPYGNTPLTTESLATLGHLLSASDFNQDAQGRYWRNIRGEKTYYAPEWFDQSGAFAGVDTDAAQAKTGTGESFFKQGQKYNWNSGEWENPTNWANVIGTLAAGGVGAGIAAPFVAGAAGGAGGAGGASGLTSGFTSGLGANATLGSVLGNPLVQGGIKTGIDAAHGNLSWKDALNFVPAIPGIKNVGGLVTTNPIARGAINAGVQSGINSAATGQFDPRKTAFDIAGGAVPGVASSVTNPIARRGLTAGLNLGLNTARTGKVDPVQAAVAGGRVLMPNTSPATGSGMPNIYRKLVNDDSGAGDGSLGLGDLTPVDDGSGGWDGWDDSDAAGSGDDAGGGAGPVDSNDPDAWIYVGVDPTDPSTGTNDDGGPFIGPHDPGGQSPGAGTTPPGITPKPTTPPAKKPGVMDDITKFLESPLGGALGGFLSGLGQSMLQQKRQSFAGTAADPAKVMGDLGTGLKGLIGNFQTRNDAGVSLPDAFVDTHSPTFTGGGMAMPVGQLPDFGAAVSSPVSLKNGIIRRDSTAPPSEPLGGDTQADHARALSALKLLGVS